MMDFWCSMCDDLHKILPSDNGAPPVALCACQQRRVQHTIDTRYLLVDGKRWISTYDGLVTVVHPDDVP